MRIISANLNGIRSATSKGFLTWLAGQNADIIGVQELKAQAADLSPEMQSPAGFTAYFHYAEKKGYSGVGLYCRRAADQVIVGLGIPEIDAEGRYLEVRFGNLSVISLYLPSGSSSEERQAVKFVFLEHFWSHLASLSASGRDVIVMGDWNIAHNEIDLKNWKGNLKNSGFLPEERAWFTRMLSELQLVDVWRTLYPEVPGYTWWSNRGQAYAKDVGWRIDYQIATPQLAATAQQAYVYKDEKFSDHAPLVIDYDYSI
ncbi:exodeoxyribonuclease III [Deefgea piscis]|uniref:Exodeoxyribonuclease III n=1 Tax=Deefgea piscis TaxID=2739061 RepID=A0A6M8SMB0_9NEIS|nr:exodeoxyribonuclease III [Deefgea piscis]QKJ66342.1 exodeoxyribonuclease III [Deefgea piscis]